MKISKFLAFSMMAATALTFGACSDDDDDDDVVTPQPTSRSKRLSSPLPTLRLRLAKQLF